MEMSNIILVASSPKNKFETRLNLLIIHTFLYKSTDLIICARLPYGKPQVDKKWEQGQNFHKPTLFNNRINKAHTRASVAYRIHESGEPRSVPS